MDGEPELVEFSEHGLGHLLNPSDPESEDRDWIKKVWGKHRSKRLGLKTGDFGFENLPAVGRVTVSSPFVMKAFTKFNAEKSYSDQIKPFNFLLTCHVNPFGHPIGTNPEHFHLIAPYESDPRKWLDLDWLDMYSGNPFRIITAGVAGTRHAARVKTYGDILREYEFHAESKCADENGYPCDKQTIGLLHRRHILIDMVRCIGKESNSQRRPSKEWFIHGRECLHRVHRSQARRMGNKDSAALKKISISTIIKMSDGLSRRMIIVQGQGKRGRIRKTGNCSGRIVQGAPTQGGTYSKPWTSE